MLLYLVGIGLCSVDELSEVTKTLSLSRPTLSSRSSTFSQVASSGGRPYHCTMTCIVVEDSVLTMRVSRIEVGLSIG